MQSPDPGQPLRSSSQVTRRPAAVSCPWPARQVLKTTSGQKLPPRPGNLGRAAGHMEGGPVSPLVSRGAAHRAPDAHGVGAVPLVLPRP